jgi:pimeloyl-ACP methyl ester carboxylesterase
MAYAAMKVIRPIVRLTSTVSPGITGRLAFRLFCTPVAKAPVRESNPVIARAKALFAGADIREVPHGCGFVRVARFEPEGQFQDQPRGTVLLVHGWAGEALFMAGFVTPLLERGYRVLALDLPAHGGSSGRRLTFPLGVEAVLAATRGYGPLAGIIGHSFGGAVSVVSASGGVPAYPALSVKRIVTVAAPRAMGPYGEAFSRMVGLTAKGHQAFEGEVMALTGRPMSSFSSRDHLAALAVPTLLIHAPDDKEIPYADAEAMAEAGPHVTLMPAPGLGHRRILFSSMVHEAAADFIAS